MSHIVSDIDLYEYWLLSYVIDRSVAVTTRTRIETWGSQKWLKSFRSSKGEAKGVAKNQVNRYVMRRRTDSEIRKRQQSVQNYMAEPINSRAELSSVEAPRPASKAHLSNLKCSKQREDKSHHLRLRLRRPASPPVTLAVAWAPHQSLWKPNILCSRCSKCWDTWRNHWEIIGILSSGPE